MDTIAHRSAEGWDPILRPLLDHLSTARPTAAHTWQTWRIAPIGGGANNLLYRCDNNLRNFVRRPGCWASVDWEYGGWGDPAFDAAQCALGRDDPAPTMDLRPAPKRGSRWSLRRGSRK
jgi:hypothetical protein